MPPSLPSRLQVESLDGVTIVRFLDAVIDADLVLNEIRDDLYRMADGLPGPRFLLNLGSVRKYSTQLIGNLLGLQQRLVKAGGRLKLCSLAPNLMDAVHILHLGRIFEVYPGEQDALEAFRTGN